MNHPLFGKRPSEIPVEDIQSLSSEDFICYTNWLTRVRLTYLVAEGFVEIKGEDKSGGPLFKLLVPRAPKNLLTENELENLLLKDICMDLERFI